MRYVLFGLRLLYLLPVAAVVYSGCLLIKLGMFCLGDGWVRVEISRDGYPTEIL